MRLKHQILSAKSRLFLHIVFVRYYSQQKPKFMKIIFSVNIVIFLNFFIYIYVMMLHAAAFRNTYNEPHKH